MSRPVVGISATVRASGGDHVVTMSTRYSDAVYRAGGVPVTLAALLDGDPPVDDVLGAVDALLFTGGPDFRTEPLGLGPMHPEARPGPAGKQSFDVALARGALSADMPMLGICYGMQLLGVVTGAGLLQHLPDDRPGARVRHSSVVRHSGVARHDVNVSPGSRTGKILGGVRRLPVVSAHHQALADAGPGWLVSARDDEGLVEAIESRSHRFAVGVQWHPEREEPGTTAHAGLFRALVEAAS